MSRDMAVEVPTMPATAANSHTPHRSEYDMNAAAASAVAVTAATGTTAASLKVDERNSAERVRTLAGNPTRLANSELGRGSFNPAALESPWARMRLA